MRIGIATDHGGFPLKEQLIARLKFAGHEVVDFGAHQLLPDDDYPFFISDLPPLTFDPPVPGLGGEPCCDFAV